MTGRKQRQLSMQRIVSDGNMFEDGQNGQTSAEAFLKAFSFGPFRILPYARLLECDGSSRPIGSRAFDLLCLLVSRPGEVVHKSELMARVWPGVTVEESTLRFHMTKLRRALGSGQGGERYVVNIPGRGYCFVASVYRQHDSRSRTELAECDRSISPRCST